MKTKKKNDVEKDVKDDLSFDESFDDVEEDSHSKAVRVLDKLRKMNELDEHNPLERAEKFDVVKKHPVKPGYMKVGCYKVTDEDGDTKVVSVSRRDDGTYKKIVHDPFMVIDPNMLYASNVAQCPMNVVPMLIDQAEQQEALRKDTFIRRKEKRGEFNWWWLVLVGLIIVSVIGPLYLVVNMFWGGG